VYGIPYRSMFSRNIKNLFLAGRIVSVSHVAFGSTRVMGTCSTSAQAVALAAVLCRKHGLLPADIAKPPFIRELQRNLIRAGQYIPGVRLDDDEDLARTAAITASSRYILDRLPASKVTRTLRASQAMMLPVAAGPLPAITLRVDANAPTRLDVELRASSQVGNFSPDTVIARAGFDLRPGHGQEIRADFKARVEHPQYVFVCLMRNPAIAVHLSDARVTGVTAVEHHRTQEPPHDSGIESFELWSPTRRPEGHNYAIVCDPPIDVFQPANVANGYTRPTTQPNAWVARPDDPSPRLSLRWPRSQTLARVHLFFDTDHDHPMESVLMGHPERDMPFCVRRYKLTDEQGRVLHETADNHQSRNVIRFEKPISTSALHIDVQETHGAPVAIFEVSCYSA
jgi:hypothetical protein